MKTCGECENYLGFGDWNLCCRESHDPNEFTFGHLCYSDTPACDKFKPIVNKCYGCFYENVDDTTDSISNCVCCSRMVEFAKEDHYVKRI